MYDQARRIKHHLFRMQHVISSFHHASYCSSIQKRKKGLLYYCITQVLTTSLLGAANPFCHSAVARVFSSSSSFFLALLLALQTRGSGADKLSKAVRDTLAGAVLFHVVSFITADRRSGDVLIESFLLHHHCNNTTYNHQGASFLLARLGTTSAGPSRSFVRLLVVRLQLPHAQQGRVTVASPYPLPALLRTSATDMPMGIIMSPFFSSSFLLILSSRANSRTGDKPTMASRR
ncbi:hypothetical protein J3F83DRAFT_236049 [Trichoderma novae-zelandiae]